LETAARPEWRREWPDIFVSLLGISMSSNSHLRAWSINSPLRNARQVHMLTESGYLKETLRIVEKHHAVVCTLVVVIVVQLRGYYAAGKGVFSFFGVVKIPARV
jgi:hypothetical protein